MRRRLLKSEPSAVVERDIQQIDALQRRKSELGSLSGVISICGHGRLARFKSVGRAEAMRRAMLAVMADTSRPANWVPAGHPSVWAPFVVVGRGGAVGRGMDRRRQEGRGAATAEIGNRLASVR